MTDEAYERREIEMAWEAKALMAICDNARTWQAGDGSVSDPQLVGVSDASRAVGRLVGAEMHRLTAERDAALADAANLTEFGIDLAVYEGVEAQRDEADRQLEAMTENYEELRTERAQLWPAAQVLPVVEANWRAAEAALQRVREAVGTWHNYGCMRDANPPGSPCDCVNGKVRAVLGGLLATTSGVDLSSTPAASPVGDETPEHLTECVDKGTPCVDGCTLPDEDETPQQSRINDLVGRLGDVQPPQTAAAKEQK